MKENTVTNLISSLKLTVLSNNLYEWFIFAFVYVGIFASVNHNRSCHKYLLVQVAVTT